MDPLLFQYIIIAFILAFAGYYLFKIIRNNISFKKFKNSDSGCDKDCGCS
jgi:hypothetical protein